MTKAQSRSFFFFSCPSKRCPMHRGKARVSKSRQGRGWVTTVVKVEGGRGGSSQQNRLQNCSDEELWQVGLLFLCGGRLRLWPGLFFFRRRRCGGGCGGCDSGGGSCRCSPFLVFHLVPICVLLGRVRRLHWRCHRRQRLLFSSSSSQASPSSLGAFFSRLRRRLGSGARWPAQHACCCCRFLRASLGCRRRGGGRPPSSFLHLFRQHCGHVDSFFHRPGPQSFAARTFCEPWF